MPAWAPALLELLAVAAVLGEQAGTCHSTCDSEMATIHRVSEYNIRKHQRNTSTPGTHRLQGCRAAGVLADPCCSALPREGPRAVPRLRSRSSGSSSSGTTTSTSMGMMLSSGTEPLPGPALPWPLLGTAQELSQRRCEALLWRFFFSPLFPASYLLRIPPVAVNWTVEFLRESRIAVGLFTK